MSHYGDRWIDVGERNDRSQMALILRGVVALMLTLMVHHKNNASASYHTSSINTIIYEPTSTLHPQGMRFMNEDKLGRYR